jgi:hypothetical protein
MRLTPEWHGQQKTAEDEEQRDAGIAIRQPAAEIERSEVGIQPRHLIEMHAKDGQRRNRTQPVQAGEAIIFRRSTDGRRRRRRWKVYGCAYPEAS